MPIRVKTVEIQANLQWQCFRANGGHWIGICDPLKLTVQSDTWGELMEDIGNTLNVMFKDLLETQELEAFLANHGWTPVGVIPHNSKNVRFDVPFIPVRVNSGPQANVYQ